MNESVIVFSGKIASGKSSLSAALARTLSLPRVSFGDYVRNVAAYLGLESSDRETLQDLGAFLAKRPVPFCRQVLAQAGDKQAGSIIVDGLRHVSILDEQVTLVAPRQVVLVYVRASDATVERRSRQRRVLVEADGPEKHSTEYQVETLLRERADIIVDNDETVSIAAATGYLLRQLRWETEKDGRSSDL